MTHAKADYLLEAKQIIQVTVQHQMTHAYILIMNQRNLNLKQIHFMH